VKNWQTGLVILKIAIAMPLLIMQPSWAQEKRLENQILRVNDLKEASTNAADLLARQPNNGAIAQISEVKINPTDTGVEIILVTTESENLQITTNNEGNSFIVEIPNAQIVLRSGQPIRTQNPRKGIREIAIANQDPKTIRLTVTGETTLPTVELFDSEEGLIFNATSSVASTPSTPPLARGETEGGQEGQVIPITGVQLNSTETGLELILQTPPGSAELLQPNNLSEGNRFITEIPNAQLQKPFRQENPLEGISEVTVTNFDASTIRVTAIGETTIPQVELFDSDEGLIFGLTPTDPSAQTPPVQPSTQAEIIPVTGVQLNPSDTGLELILQTPTGSAELLQTNNLSEGNRFITEIPNAQLQKPFRQEKPIEGISEVTVTNFDASTIRVTAIGETAIPQVELFDSDEGLIFGLTPTDSSAQTPTPQPEEGRVATIDRVQLNPTETGFEILLLTPTGVAQQLRVVNVSEGNNFIADIPNAQLQKPFRQEKPIEGVSEIAVTNQNENTVRVTVIGEEKQPTVELFDSEEGLIFSAQTAPQGEDDIELVVTGEQETGYNVPDASTATRTDAQIRDIPQSIQVIPRQVIEDQGITQISDVTQNISSVSVRTGFGGSNNDYVIRGFETFDRLRNGFFAPGVDINPSNVERVEVLKGPASVLYGQFEPGGIINFITKQPLERPYYAAEFEIGNYDFYKPSFDLSGPITSDNSLLYRLNVAYENSGSFIDFVDREEIQVSPTLTYKIGDSTNLSLSYEFLKSDGTFYDGLPIDPVAFDLPRSRFLGEPDDSLERESHLTNLTLEHRFSENWKIRSGLSLQFFNTQISAFRNEFDGVNPDGRTLLRYFQDSDQRSDAYSLQNDVIGKFKTGPIEHELLVGFEYQRYTQDDYTLYAFAESIDLFDPVYGAPVPTVFDYGPFRNILRRETVGFYVQNLISFLPNLKLLIGGRYDFIDAQTVNQNFDLDGQTLLGEQTKESFYDEAFSPRIGLVYQPIEPISLYASYSRSFVPSNTFDREGELIEPTRGTQYEIGIKTEFLDGNLAATLAAYKITKTNVLTLDPDGSGFSIPVGEVESEGIELDIAGEPLPGWRIIASLFFNNTTVTEGDEFSPEGDTLVNAPGEGASLWTTYEIQEGDLQGLGFGVGVFYVGDREARLPNTFVLPSYVRTDAAIFYRRDNWRVGLNFRNLFDKTYYEGSGIRPGDPFTVLGTISIQF
jgi:iron complex outermembrane recepter protein